MNKKVVWLCESAIMIAAATVLSIIAIIKMPFGGDVTACSMLPIILVAYRYGVKKGLFVGFIYGIVQMLLGFNNLSYATTLTAAFMIVAFDYLFAFGVLGFAGAFKKSGNKGIAMGSILVCFLRYICHVISGCTVWAGVSIPTADGLKYSLVYNAAYMIPESIVTIAVIVYLASILDLSNERIGRITKSSEKTSIKDILKPISSLLLIFAASFDAVLIFSSIQTASGFNIANIKSAPISLMIIVTVSALIISAIIYLIGFKAKNR